MENITQEAIVGNGSILTFRFLSTMRGCYFYYGATKLPVIVVNSALREDREALATTIKALQTVHNNRLNSVQHNCYVVYIYHDGTKETVLLEPE